MAASVEPTKRDKFMMPRRRQTKAATADSEVRQFLQDAVAAAVALVERLFSDAVNAGEVPSDFRQPSALARTSTLAVA